MKSMIFPKGTFNVALVGMLGAMLVMPFAADARLVQKAPLGGGVASALAVGSAKVFEGVSFSAPDGGAHQSLPTPQRQNVVLAILPGFWTVLAAAVLALPFGLSTLRILRRNRRA
jgi:hypothetical protein